MGNRTDPGSGCALTGPIRGNFDLALAKTTAIMGERLKMELRADFFNIS